MLTEKIKQKIITAIRDNRANFSGSDAKYSVSLGINKAVFSRLMKGDTERVLAESKWVTLARKFEVSMGSVPAWVITQTPTFKYITKQLQYCQRESTAGIFCDHADIGKTTAAKEFVKTSKNSIYIDCSQAKTKQKLIRAIALGFGLDSRGKYNDVYEDFSLLSESN